MSHLRQTIDHLNIYFDKIYCKESPSVTVSLNWKRLSPLIAWDYHNLESKGKGVSKEEKLNIRWLLYEVHYDQIWYEFQIESRGAEEALEKKSNTFETKLVNSSCSRNLVKATHYVGIKAPRQVVVLAGSIEQDIRIFYLRSGLSQISLGSKFPSQYERKCSNITLHHNLCVQLLKQLWILKDSNHCLEFQDLLDINLIHAGPLQND